MNDKPSRVVSRPGVARVSPATHGAFDYAELEQLGLSPDDVLDFSVNSNPYGPSPAVRRALAEVPLDRYPDREALALRRALAEQHRRSVDQIVVGNGTAELLWLIAFAFLEPSDPVLIIGPTFGEYGRVAALMGAAVKYWNASSERAFGIDPRAVARLLREGRPRLVFLCNPNNPTGAILPLEDIDRWAAGNPETLFVVDEAYLAFAQGLESALILGAANVLVVRSMTKDYALAGLRLGYAAGPEPLTAAVACARPAWNVNALAQVAGISALADDAYYRRTWSGARRAGEALVKGLADTGMVALPSAVHFFLLRVGDGTDFRRSLLRHRILVRDCTSFGLPEYVRIAPRRRRDNARLLAAVRSWAACRRD